MERSIFISYSRKDLQNVTIIKKEIEEKTDLMCWMDLTGIESGTFQFQSKIVEGINNAHVFLFMLSDNSQASEFAIRELNFAYNKAKEEDKHVVILNINKCKMTDEFFLMYGMTDIIDWHNLPQREKLYRDIKAWIVPTASVEEVSLFACQIPITCEYWGYKNENDKLVIPYAWKLARDFKEGLGLVMNEKHKWGMIDKDGNLKIPCRWDSLSPLSEGLAAASDGEKRGYINRHGQFVLPIKGRTWGSFSEGLAYVANNQGLYGYINKQGEIVIPHKWSSAEEFSEGLAAVCDKEGRTGYIMKNGDISIEGQWDYASEFVNGVAKVSHFDGEDDIIWLINKNGEQISSDKWTELDGFFWSDHKYCTVKDKNGKWGVIDKKGQYILPCRWNSIQEGRDDLFFVQNHDEKWGVIDKKGQQILPCRWNSIAEWGDGMFHVQNQDNKWGVIDRNGNIIIPFKWKWVGNFENDRAFVRNDYYKVGFIDKKGKEIIPCKFRNFIESDGDRFLVEDPERGYVYIDHYGSYLNDKVPDWTKLLRESNI